jgi:hypothetical protein
MVAGNPVNLVASVDRSLQDPMPAAACQALPFHVDVATRNLRVPHGIGGSLPIKVTRSAPASEAIRIEPRTRIPSFPTGVDTTIEKDQSDGSIPFPGNVEFGRSQGTMIFTAISQVAGREVRVTLPPVFVALVPPFAVQLPVRQVTLTPASPANLPIVLQREAGFDGEIRFRADNLPKGISVATPTVPAGQIVGNIEIKAEGIAPGEYTIRLVGLADFSGRKQTKDYELAAEEIKIVVPAP